MRQAKVKVEDPEASFQSSRMANRYMRYIITALLCFAALFFFSTNSAPSRTQLQDASDRLLEKLGQRPVPAPPATAAPPSVDDAYRQSDSAPTANYPYEQTDADTTPNYPHNLPPPTRPGERVNATFVTLARNSDIWDISRSIRQVEDRFNRKFNYDWVFLNDKEFDDTFKKITTALVSGKTKYGLIPEEHWSFPSWIDQSKAAAVREDMKQRKIIYGDSISYRHMCRFESGFFFRHPLMQEYDWYWRVEPSIELFCDIDYDAFKFMADNNKKYSFTLSLYEYFETIPTIWDSVQKFMQNHPEHISANNSMDFLSDDGGKTYNKCHFWSNFEIGNLNWLRSDAYLDFFKQLDEDGGFFYERWGDAPVHSIAAGLTLSKDQIHFFNDIAYYHVPFTHCPLEEKTRMERKCHCNPKENFDWNGYSCTARFFELHGLEKPEGAPLTDRERRNRIILWILWVSGIGIALMAWIIKRLKRL